MSLSKRLFSLVMILVLLSSVFLTITEPSTAEAADTWTSMPSGTTEDLYGVWGSACNSVFAVGANGTIMRWNGTNWASITSGTTMGLQGIWGSSADNIFIVGWSGTILHWNGSSWSAMTSSTGNDLYAVWGNAPNSVFAVGSMETIVYWDGSTWTSMTTPAEEIVLRAVWGTAYNNVYAIGNDGTILHFNGTSWTQMDSGTSYNLYGIWGSSATDVWAAGETTQSKRHYEGSSWNGMSYALYEYYRGIWGTSASNIYIAGHSWMAGGAIYHYNGSSWSILTTPACSDLNDIWGSGSSDIFAVGDDGTIMHYGGCQGGTTSAAINTTLGTVILNTNAGYISNSAWLAPVDVRCSNPSGFNFPYGMFSFNINNLTSGEQARVTINFSNPLPLGIRYYKCINGSLVDVTSLITRINEYTLILTLTDGGPGDADGVANGTIVDPGGPAFPIAVTQSSSAQMSVTAPQKPVSLFNISVKSASLSATKVTPGTPVTVTASVANTGTGNGASVIKVYVNGIEDAQQGVTVNSGSTSTVSFDVTRNEPGTYTVHVGGTQAGSFTVDQFTPDTILFISGALVFFSLVLGVIYMTRRRA